MTVKKADIREKLKDVCNIFHLLDGDKKEELNLLQVEPDAIVVDAPEHLPKNKNIKGYIQKLSLELFYAVEGIVSEPLPGQKPKTLRIIVDPDSIRSFDRRIYPRHVLREPVEAMVTSYDEMEALIGAIINLSPAGLRVEVPERLNMETRYTFSFELDFRSQTYSLALTGTPVSETRLSETWVYGVWLGEGKDDRQVIIEDEETDTWKKIDLMELVNKLIKCS
ncbi:MAG: PilZ domain-containing protein [Pseudomonadota bacterium]